MRPAQAGLIAECPGTRRVSPLRPVYEPAVWPLSSAEQFEFLPPWPGVRRIADVRVMQIPGAIPLNRAFVSLTNFKGHR